MYVLRTRIYYSIKYMHIILDNMQNPSSINGLKTSNDDETRKTHNTPTIFRGMSFNTANTSIIPPTQMIKTTPVTNVTTQRHDRSNKNFMFRGFANSNNNTMTNTHSLKTMSIINDSPPSALRVRNPAVSQPQNYSLRLEKNSVEHQKLRAEAQAKQQATIEAAKLRAKVKAEADVKSRAQSRRASRAAAKAAALERAQRAKDEAAAERARIPSWERNSVSTDPSDTPYGV